MASDSILVNSKNKVAFITINRPQVLNALDVPTLLSLESTLTQLENESEVHVIVITGAGEKAFVAGGDIADLDSRKGLDHYQEFAEVIHRVFRRFETSDKPTIAAVNGYALGGGAELLMSVDIRILADTAKIGFPEILLGIFPGAGGTQRLIRQISPCKAKQLMFTGDQIGAKEAVELGLANMVVPKQELMSATIAIAEKIAAKSPLTLKLLKRAILHGSDMTLANALSYEQSVVSLVFDSGDAHEGCGAFLSKRTPQFRGV